MRRHFENTSEQEQDYAGKRFECRLTKVYLLNRCRFPIVTYAAMHEHRMPMAFRVLTTAAPIPGTADSSTAPAITEKSVACLGRIPTMCAASNQRVPAPMCIRADGSVRALNMPNRCVYATTRKSSHWQRPWVEQRVESFNLNRACASLASGRSGRGPGRRLH